LGHVKDALRRVKLPSKPSQAIEGPLEISNELVVGSGLDDHVIHVSFNVAVQLIREAQLDGPLIGGSCVLQPEGHRGVCVCSKEGDERHFDLVFLLESYLMITRVAVEEGEQDAASCRVDNLVDAWKREGVLRAVFLEISIIHTYPPFIIILVQYKYMVS
jgi:hypothetical protein